MLIYFIGCISDEKVPGKEAIFEDYLGRELWARAGNHEQDFDIQLRLSGPQRTERAYARYAGDATRQASGAYAGERPVEAWNDSD